MGQVKSAAFPQAFAQHLAKHLAKHVTTAAAELCQVVSESETASPLTCDRCGKACSSMEALTRHRRKHPLGSHEASYVAPGAHDSGLELHNDDVPFNELPNAAANIDVPPGGECPLYDMDQQLQIAEQLINGGSGGGDAVPALAAAATAAPPAVPAMGGVATEMVPLLAQMEAAMQAMQQNLEAMHQALEGQYVEEID